MYPGQTNNTTDKHHRRVQVLPANEQDISAYQRYPWPRKPKNGWKNGPRPVLKEANSSLQRSRAEKFWRYEEWVSFEEHEALVERVVPRQADTCLEEAPQLFFSNVMTVWLHCQYGAPWLLNCHRMVVAAATASSAAMHGARVFVHQNQRIWLVNQTEHVFKFLYPVIRRLFLYSPSKFVTTSHAYKDPGQAVCKSNLLAVCKSKLLAVCICSREHAAVLRSPCHSVCKHGRVLSALEQL